MKRIRRAPWFKPFTALLGGEPWTVRSKPVVIDGDECWGAAVFGKREILIDPDTRHEGNEREIVIHECLHAIYPHADELVIAYAAREIDNVLEILDL